MYTMVNLISITSLLFLTLLSLMTVKNLDTHFKFSYLMNIYIEIITGASFVFVQLKNYQQFLSTKNQNSIFFLHVKRGIFSVYSFKTVKTILFVILALKNSENSFKIYLYLTATIE